jgi:hypothetical protein
MNAIKSVLTSLDSTRAFARITLRRGVAVVMALTMAWTTPALAKVSCERALLQNDIPVRIIVRIVLQQKQESDAGWSHRINPF